MGAPFQLLPTILLLAVLLAMFVALRRHARSNRVQWWIWAWALVLVHFLADWLAQRGTLPQLAAAVRLASLGAAGMVFVVSLVMEANTRARLALLLSLTLVPTVVYSVAIMYDVHAALLYAACAAVICFGAPAVCAYLHHPSDDSAWPIALALVAVGVWMLVWIAQGKSAAALQVLLTAAFALPAALFWRHYRRRSAGVWAVVLGFLGWAAVFPLGPLFAAKYPGMTIHHELWNVPKFLVAIGMVVATVEDATLRELAVSRQLQRFGELISKMLSGLPAEQVCDAVAAAILQTSSFTRASILLRSPNGLMVAGMRGLPDEAVARIRQHAPRWSADDIARAIAASTPLGAHSFRQEAADAAAFDVVSCSASAEPAGQVLIPLRSRRGGHVGCIVLFELHSRRARPEDLVRLEMLAADLAIALENDELQQQLVSTEKMAAMGRLVAGVAHELNNPLTAVLGYADLLSDDTAGASHQQVQKLAREAQRMKRIIGNLLVFARKEAVQHTEADLDDVLRQVLALREYNLNALGIRLEVEVDPDLPRLAIDPDRMRQILLNLMNNAVDAVSASPEKVIRVIGLRKNARVILRVEDTGTGFSDLQRAMDPFFTTKPVGKGTGLGLSICYGIVRELGGNVHLQNLEPAGAAVTIDLPAAMSAGAIA